MDILEAIHENLTFATTSSSVAWVSNQIATGTKQYCRGWRIYNPSYMPVVIHRNWNNSLEDFQQALTKFYDDTLVPSDGPVRSQDAVMNDHRFYLNKDADHTGLFVAVFIHRPEFKKGEPGRDEWYRGVITGKPVRFQTDGQVGCKIFLLDFGEHVVKKLKYVRRIPEKYLKLMPAQAINCSLEFDGDAKHLNGLNMKWTKGESNVFMKLMEGCRYLVHFLRMEFCWDLYPATNPIVWKVRIWIWQSENSLVETEEISGKFLRECQKEHEKQNGSNMLVEEFVCRVDSNLWATTDEYAISFEDFNIFSESDHSTTCWFIPGKL